MIVGCLALNASFEPLTMVPVRRALRLVIDGKAEIVETDPAKVVRSASLSMPRPAVIRLTKFVHVPRRFRRQVTNTFLFARDRYRCQYCGRSAPELKPREALTRDHVIPISCGKWFALRVLHVLHAVTTFVHSFVPPRDMGMRWSRVSASRGFSSGAERPQYWQR